MMDKDTIIELIKSRGYWRVNFQPLVDKDVLDSSEKRKRIVERNIVDYVGWDYPHYPTHDDTYQEIQPGNKYTQALTNFGPHKEFWRIYESSQFIHYFGIWDDWWIDDTFQRADLMAITPLTLINSIYGIVSPMLHIFKFLNNLIMSGLYSSGIKLSINIEKLSNRNLWNPHPQFLFVRSKMSNDDFEYIRIFKKEDILLNYQQYSIEATAKLFELFDWNPSEEALAIYQKDLMEKRF